MQILFDLIKILLPAGVVLYAVYLVIRSFIRRELDSKQMELRAKSLDAVLPTRLQAYERMMLFLERISADALLVRLNAPGLTAKDFQRILLEEIRNEYNHNASQQIYMSEELWSQIKNAKEELCLIINDAANRVQAESSGVELAKIIFEISLDRKTDLTAHAAHVLKEEVQLLF
ncbi:MAG: hypothetical protein CRN43_02690 [Candidatus Nephrothrix sp. EaCA]|nr:MAG: hypothetical protein CRN43_02690 [Candidatus Nephrothrix sp. EaCA]